MPVFYLVTALKILLFLFSITIMKLPCFNQYISLNIFNYIMFCGYIWNFILLINAPNFENNYTILPFRIITNFSYFLIPAFVLLLNYITVDKKNKNKENKKIQKIITYINIFIFIVILIFFFIFLILFLFIMNNINN